MQRRTLGKELNVSAIGLGCMDMSGNLYGKVDEAQAVGAIHKAIDIGIDMIDTSDSYAGGKNEELVGSAIADRRDKVILATKFGQVRHPDGKMDIVGTPEYVRSACEASLKRLGIDHIDLYYQHRVDGKTPIEDTIGEMVKLKDEGKIRYLGLSEAGADTIARAHAVHPITALQTEYSLWSRDVEGEILPLIQELGIGYVSYSPLGRGFLTGTIDNRDDLQEKDGRLGHPRFAAENIEKNKSLIDAIRTIAGNHGVTPAQVAIAWVLSRSQSIVPIPGTKRPERVVENAAAGDINLSADEISSLEQAFPVGAAHGTRYPAGHMPLLGI
jgi:aryl-alcohol dehydrogenase-like predicted oxidoreductase